MEEKVHYDALPTIAKFHMDEAQIRCIIGPVGSGKTSGASAEVCWYIPRLLVENYGIMKSRWCVVRNTYSELRDTTQKTIFDWFEGGDFHKQENVYYYKTPENHEVEILFRSCDRPEDVKKFKSLEITGYWVDESIEVKEEIKNMLKNRIGRYPRKCPVRFGIETSNPPDVEHHTFTQFQWIVPPPGPQPEVSPLANHHGFWQPERENENNLPPGYYDRLIEDYRDYPDWIATYIKGMPGIILKGKNVYHGFSSEEHVAISSVVAVNKELFRGWDNSGNIPACVVCQLTPNMGLQVLAEYCGDVENIVNFTRRVTVDCNLRFPGSSFTDYGDPAGETKYSNKGGGFTSNAQLMKDECNVIVLPSEQSYHARIGAIEGLLRQRDGLLVDPSCVRLKNGFLGGYCYAEIGSSGIYREQPEKNKFSHCLVGETRVMTPSGEVRIAEICPGDYIVTPMGNKLVTATMNSIAKELLRIETSDGTVIFCTKDHPFITEKGIALADTLQYNDVLKSIYNAKENKTWDEHRNTRSKNSTALSFIINHLATIRLTIANMVASICTVMYGNIIKEQSHMGRAFTTSTGTNQTTPSSTFTLSVQKDTEKNTREKIILKIQNECGEVFLLHRKQLKHGINQKREEYGTQSTEEKHGLAEKKKQKNVSIAGENIPFLGVLLKKASALLHVNLIIEEGRALIMKLAPALYVGQVLSRINTQKTEHAVRIVAINYVAGPRKVYDLTVAASHCFYANGILVGNCHDALQYVAVKLFKSKQSSTGCGFVPKRKTIMQRRTS